MKISFVIPSYGQAPYLRTAIESSIHQFYSNIEIIVVDDGSTDGSLEIAKMFGSRIKLIEQSNKGLASARNAGIMNSTGDYVFFLDADDILMARCIERLVEEAIRTNADVIAPSIRCFDNEGNVQDTILLPNPSFNDFKEGNRLAYCALIKREALLEVGGYSPKYDVLGGWEDLALWYALMKRGKKIVTPQEPLVMYRVKEKSMWKDAAKNSKALWEQIVKDFPEAKEHAKS